MILLCGIPSETPLAMVRRQLEQLSAPCVVFNQRHFPSLCMEWGITGRRVHGLLHIGEQRVRLEEVQGVYSRLMDEQLLPELAASAANSAERTACRALHETLLHWQEVAPCRVVNRPAPMGSNFSKPYQAQLIAAQGFAVPETLITNEPDQVRAFLHQYRRVIYKSISGVRSIVHTLEEADLARLDQLRGCPVQFQQYIEGTNVRVHTVQQEVFATTIRTTAPDYRYAGRQGYGEPELEAIELPDHLAERCVRLAQALGLVFAGIDLKMTAEGEAFCLEVNPCPAFSYYESHTAQPIAQALARYLAGLASEATPSPERSTLPLQHMELLDSAAWSAGTAGPS